MRGRWDVGFASYGRWYSKDGVELRCRQCGAVNRSEDVAKEAPVCAQCGAALRVLKYMTAWGRVLIGIAFFAAITAIFLLREGG
ncbi:MAG: hypothetical protein MI741_16450 [Rhodospirillales bacterium]|nr:hypothetical protein [Rhodospirillales bacterium]